MAAKTITLYSPSGEKYETTSATEANQLKFGGAGYTTTPPKSEAKKSK